MPHSQHVSFIQLPVNAVKHFVLLVILLGALFVSEQAIGSEVEYQELLTKAQVDENPKTTRYWLSGVRKISLTNTNTTSINLISTSLNSEKKSCRRNHRRRSSLPCILWC